jgi:hypothetical protein
MRPSLTSAAHLTLALDPGRFFVRATGYTPDAWQTRVLRSDAQRIILNCSRQSGKSTVTAALGLHAALYQPDSLILMVAPTLRQSQEVFKKSLAAYRVLGRPVASSAESALSLTLMNGARLIALPGDEATIRSYSGVSLLIVDEASRVPDDVYISVRPMVAVSGGRVILLSTPHGRMGFFYETWAHGGSLWHREEVPASACLRIPRDFLDEERRDLGPWYEQEYGCQFLDSQFQLFATDDIERAVDDGVPPLFG